MPNPKRKLSKARRNSRRTHQVAGVKQIAIDSTTGEAHVMHRAHWVENKLYYKGKVVMEKASKA